jgi:HlyD family secretion protein
MSSAQATRVGVKRRAKRTIRVLPTIIIAAAAVGLGWYGWNRSQTADNPAAKLITAKVEKGDLTETINATGSVTAQTGAMVKIGSQITGRIKRLYADVGSPVRAGQVIAELDLPDIEAQLSQAQANAALARTRALQQQTGQGMQQTQTSTAVMQARSEVAAAEARLASARAAAKLQSAQTPTEIRRAETALAAAQAALRTAKSDLAQIRASGKLQVSTAQEQLNQTKANATNADAQLRRQVELNKKGFVSNSVVDDARATAAIYQSQVTAATQNVELVKEKVAADQLAANDRVTQAEQNVESAKAALIAAEAGRLQNDVRGAAVKDALQQVAQATSALRAAKANTTQNTLKAQDIQGAQEAARAAEAQVDFYRAQLAKTQIRSPITGTVIQLASQQGETLAAGLSAPTLIIVADLNRLQVDAFVDETDIGKVRLGQEVEIRVDAYPRQTVKGRVFKIASGSTIQQGVVTYGVSIAIEKSKLQLKPDMTASVTIETGKKKGVLLVPSEAVKASGRGSTVNVVTSADPKAEPEKRQVKIGASDGTNTEIREGLKEGDTVVLAGGNTDDAARRRGQGGGPASPFGPPSRGGGGRGGGGGR